MTTMAVDRKLEPMTLRVDQIEESHESLRPAQTDSDDFKDLLKDISRNGILESLLIRRVREEGQADRYVLADGLQRFTCACMLGLETVPCLVGDISEDDVLEVQISTNTQGVETRPVHLAKGLARLLKNNPDRTIEYQAERLGRSAGWYKGRMGLLVLDGTKAGQLIDAGEIKVSNAYALAKLQGAANEAGTPEIVEEWLERAKKESPDKFFKDCTEEAKRVRAKHRNEAPPEGPPEKCRKVVDIRAEAERVRVRANERPDDAFLKGFRDALDWVLQVDAVSVEAWKRAQEEREKARAEKAAKRAAGKKDSAEDEEDTDTEE